jgi:hypothetical protein
MSPGNLEPPIAVGVACYAGYRGEETPRRFRLAESVVEITEVGCAAFSPAGTESSSGCEL